MCSFCTNENLENFDQLKDHIGRWHTLQPIACSSCNICDKVEPIDDFEYHIIQKHLRDPSSWFCFKVMTIDETIEINNPKPCFSYSFEICRERFSILRVKSSEDWVYKCKEHEMVFSRLESLGEHIRINHKIHLVQLVCNTCGKEFDNILSCHSHVYISHKRNISIIFHINVCFSSRAQGKRLAPEAQDAICKKTKMETKAEFAYDIDSQNDHCMILTGREEANYVCNLCQIDLVNCKKLVDHIESSHIHDKISYSICDVCCRVLNTVYEFPGHISLFHGGVYEKATYQFKLISMKTTVLEDIEDGLSMRDLLTPSPTDCK